MIGAVNMIVGLFQSGSTVVLVLVVAAAIAEPSHVDTVSLRNIANVSYAAENSKPTGVSSLFSPRMEFEQWKPLTGRGDPLRNDPTFDYEPPLLDHVHFWYDEARLEREHYPEKKGEVLVLGVSSRKPSVPPRPSAPPKRYYRPTPNYEDYTYKLSNHYPMTILVPPPLPPPGHKLPLFVLNENTSPKNFPNKPTEVPILKETTTTTEQLTSLYSLQEGNLVYHSSTTSQNWILDDNQTKQPNNAVSSDFSGWGPTTPLDEAAATNEKQNFIPNEKFEFSKHPYSFYKPMLSEAPPPPRVTTNPLLLPTFVPTALPPTTTPQPPATTIKPQQTTTDFYTDSQDYFEQTTTEKRPPSKSPVTKPSPSTSMFDMLKPMLSMPLLNGPDRLEDNLYEHASESMQVFKEQEFKNVNIETMQTMQPPPQNTEVPESQKYPIHISHNVLMKKPVKLNHDPYLHMRFTTPKPIRDIHSDSIDSTRSTEAPSETVTPMYLIIQGHSKVKTYGSKPKLPDDTHTFNNEIPKRNETTEVKHLHTNKEKYRKVDIVDVRRNGKAQNLRSLLDNGFGSIELQEADVGIKYDVSDGSEVPIEIYRKGVVDNGENDYYTSKKGGQVKRSKKQVDLEDIIPFDEDVIEEYVYDFLNGKRNETSITGLIAQAVTSDVAGVVDDLEDDDDEEDQET